MNDLITGVSVASIGAIVLRSSILLVFGLAATRLLRRAPSALRHLVWAATLCGAILVPVLSPLLPSLRLPLPQLSSLDISWLTPVSSEAIGAPGQDGAVVGAMGVGSSEGSEAPPAGYGPERSVWLEWAFILWVAGALVMAARLLVGVAAVWSLARRATMMTDGEWLHLAHDLAGRLGLKRGVTLMRGDRGLVPMTWGVLQPVIWLPAEAADWSTERRAVVLAHELAHVRRRDALVQWIGHLALAAYWFNPLVWFATRRLHEEREHACDDAVLRMGTAPASYADHLLEVVRALGQTPAPPAAMAMARRSHFEGRIRAILDRAARRDAIGTRGAAVIGAIAVGLILPVAALSTEGASAAMPGEGAIEGGGRGAEAPGAVAAAAATGPRGAQEEQAGSDVATGGQIRSRGTMAGDEGEPAASVESGKGADEMEARADAHPGDAGGIRGGGSSASEGSGSTSRAPGASSSASASHSTSATSSVSESQEAGR